MQMTGKQRWSSSPQVGIVAIVVQPLGEHVGMDILARLATQRLQRADRGVHPGLHGKIERSPACFVRRFIDVFPALANEDADGHAIAAFTGQAAGDHLQFGIGPVLTHGLTQGNAGLDQQVHRRGFAGRIGIRKDST